MGDVLRSPRQKRRRAIGSVVAEPGLRGMGNASGRLSGFPSRKSANNPFPRTGFFALNLGGNRILREIEKGRECRGFHQAGQGSPLRDGKDLGFGFAMERYERQCAVGCAKINADTEAGLCHRKEEPTRPVMCDGYSVRTWNSTFHRRSEFVCFIQSSRVPSSVMTALIRTGTACPIGKSSTRGRLISRRLVSSSSRSASGRICPGLSPLRTSDEKNRNSAGCPVMRPN